MVRAVLEVKDVGDDTHIIVTYENEPATELVDPQITDNGWWKVTRSRTRYLYRTQLNRTHWGANFPAVHEDDDESPNFGWDLPHFDPRGDKPIYQPEATHFKLRKSDENADFEVQWKRKKDSEHRLIVKYPGGIAWCFNEPSGSAQGDRDFYASVIPFTYLDAASETKMGEWFVDGYLPDAFSCSFCDDDAGNFTEMTATSWGTFFYCTKESSRDWIAEVDQYTDMPCLHASLNTARPVNFVEPISFGGQQDAHSIQDPDTDEYLPFYNYKRASLPQEGPQHTAFMRYDINGTQAVSRPGAAPARVVSSIHPLQNNNALLSTVEGYVAFDLPLEVTVWTDSVLTEAAVYIQYYEIGQEQTSQQELFSGPMDDEEITVTVRAAATVPDKTWRARIVFYPIKANQGESTTVTLSNSTNVVSIGVVTGMYSKFTAWARPFAQFSMGEGYFCRGKMIEYSSHAYAEPSSVFPGP